MREMRFASQLTPRDEASDRLCTASDRSARLFENNPPATSASVMTRFRTRDRASRRSEVPGETWECPCPSCSS
jgi:hypothetical protein